VQFSAAIVAFFMLPYNVNHLGKEAYGISVMAVTAVAMLNFLSVGMGPTLLRFFAQAVAKNDHQEIRILSSTTQFVLGSLGLIGAIFIVVGTPWFIQFYEVPKNYHYDTTILLLCIAGSFFLEFHNHIFNNIVLADNRYDLVNLRRTISHWLRLILLVVFYNVFTPSLAYLGLALLIGGVYNYLALIFTCYRRFGNAIFFSFKSIAFDRLPHLFSFGFLSLINNVFFALSIQVPLLIIGKTLGTEAVTMFSPAISVAFFLAQLMSQVCNPLVPIAARDNICNQNKNLGRWAILFGQIIACMGYGCIIFAILFMPDVLRVWMGERFISMSPTVVVLVIGVTYANIQAVNYNLALGANTISPMAYSAVVMAVFTTLGTLLGTAYWNWGLLEVAWCITIIRILRNTFFLTWIYSVLFPYSFYNYFFNVYIRSSVGGLLLLAGVFLIKKYYFAFQPGLPFLALEIAVVGLLYAICAWFLSFNRETRIFLIKRGNT